MDSPTGLSALARQKVRRTVWLTRLAGVAVAGALWGAAAYIHWGSLTSRESVIQFMTVGVGLVSFVALSTLARVAHAGVLEQSLREVERLSGNLRDVAERDALTGLFNLRAFHERLEREMSNTNDSAVSLLIGDLDQFKVLNDSFGHQFGDRVLCETARVFAEAGGPSAFVARLGGDEFAIVLPGFSGAAAVLVAREIETRLAEVRIDGQRAAVLGSIGIATAPVDGRTVQEMFATADSRMYSEKHRRKAEVLSSMAGAARKLFVRVGTAMQPERTTQETLDEIARSVQEEFSLLLCAIAIPAAASHPAHVAASAASEELCAMIADTAHGTEGVALPEGLPPEAWLIETPIAEEGTAGGILILAGLPLSSFRPDASVVLALTDLVQAVISSSRAQLDAAKAGRERDIHIDLARELAGAGTLEERMLSVAEMIGRFIGVRTVSIESLVSAASTGAPFYVVSGIPDEFLPTWQAARRTPEAMRFLEQQAETSPVVLDPFADERIPSTEREILRTAGIRSVAAVAIRFDGRPLGVVAAAAREAGYFSASMLAVLQAIGDHLAPAVKVALLRDEVEASYAQLEQSSRASLARLADAAEARDPHTAGHLRRIRSYSVELALELGLSRGESDAIGEASAIHDLGKLRLADAVLHKPGALSEDDWERMREHPAQGERLIGDSPMFEVERAVARWHHERWDGSGYPDGLRGEAIPLPARIVAVADAFDALTTERPYKLAWSVQEAMDEVVARRGSMFCPRVVDAMRALHRRGMLAVLHQQNTEPSHEHVASHLRAA